MRRLSLPSAAEVGGTEALNRNRRIRVGRELGDPRPVRPDTHLQDASEIGRAGRSRDRDRSPDMPRSPSVGGNEDYRRELDDRKPQIDELDVGRAGLVRLDNDLKDGGRSPRPAAGSAGTQCDATSASGEHVPQAFDLELNLEMVASRVQSRDALGQDLARDAVCGSHACHREQDDQTSRPQQEPACAIAHVIPPNDHELCRTHVRPTRERRCQCTHVRVGMSDGLGRWFAKPIANKLLGVDSFELLRVSYRRPLPESPDALALMPVVVGGSTIAHERIACGFQEPIGTLYGASENSGSDVMDDRWRQEGGVLGD
jgi:hypothetical protein